MSPLRSAALLTLLVLAVSATLPTASAAVVLPFEDVSDTEVCQETPVGYRCVDTDTRICRMVLGRDTCVQTSNPDCILYVYVFGMYRVCVPAL